MQEQKPANTRLAGADTPATLEHPISTQKSIDPTLPPSNTSTLNSSSGSDHEPTQTQSSNTAIVEELKDAQQEAEGIRRRRLSKQQEKKALLETFVGAQRMYFGGSEAIDRSSGSEPISL